MFGESGYEICVRGVLDEKWAAYFMPFILSARENETLLTGKAHDQAELFGVLLKIRDLGLWLVSVNPQSEESCLSGNLHGKASHFGV
jgi:hypothetical protein